MTDFQPWVGRERTVTETLDPVRSDSLLAALGRSSNVANTLPLLHHWLHFWDVAPPSGLGEDGHPARGDFLPPIDLPRRMWAGGELRFIRPIRRDATVTRRSVIEAVSHKSGRSGDLIFVVLRHHLSDADGALIEERQDLVYRAAGTGAASYAPDPDVDTSERRASVQPDAVLLFRYSALTMNGHRIHYDRPYAREIEGYPGLVVQGPLQATLLLAHAQDAAAEPIAGFRFKGLSPAFDGKPLEICATTSADGIRVSTIQDGRRCMEGLAWTAGSPEDHR